MLEHIDINEGGCLCAHSVVFAVYMLTWRTVLDTRRECMGVHALGQEVHKHVVRSTTTWAFQERVFVLYLDDTMRLILTTRPICRARGYAARTFKVQVAQRLWPQGSVTGLSKRSKHTGQSKSSSGFSAMSLLLCPSPPPLPGRSRFDTRTVCKSKPPSNLEGDEAHRCEAHRD